MQADVGCATDDRPFTFMAAVQSHIVIDRMQYAEVEGLLFRSMLDSDAPGSSPTLRMEDTEPMKLSGMNALWQCRRGKSQPSCA